MRKDLTEFLKKSCVNILQPLFGANRKLKKKYVTSVFLGKGISNVAKYLNNWMKVKSSKYQY